MDAGATLRGTMRFAVCSADQCVPHQESFAVAVPYAGSSTRSTRSG
jgi:DsbC/DsbD-like thiol-disulfide interchange protein